MRRLYLPQINLGRNIISGDEFHHGRNVLRLKVSDQIEVFDGKGSFARAVVVSIGKRSMEVNIEDISVDIKDRWELVLASAIPKYSHQEIMVRMCTEVGVDTFQPIIYARSSVREKLSYQKWQRWAIEACKQSYRNYLPVIESSCRFDEFLEREELKGAFLLLADIRISGALSLNSLGGAIRDFIQSGISRRIVVFIGPEGGFTEDERAHALLKGAKGVSIGRYTLRIETACVVVSSVVKGFVDSFVGS